ncbi:protein DpdE [Micromonospora chokoriensis]|nr:protein DpdE [Micromonospora chokoriensis]
MPSRTPSATLMIGQFVEHARMPGIGRVAERAGDLVRVDAFESVASPVAASWWVLAEECQPVRLLEQTRVYWHDPDTGRWLAGRVIGGGPDLYFVRIRNRDRDFQVPQEELRVRWDRRIQSPVEVLAAGAHESPHFRDARLPMLGSLVAQRAACASLPALLSAGVEIYTHQVQAAMTVLSDPVQRYLLADEVGLGKTIEAGLVIRQHLLDRPASRILIVAPDVLRRQWQAELKTKFYIDDFPAATVRITSHETPDRWPDYHGFDLVIVDEAHRLCRTDDPNQSPYRDLTLLAHSTPRLLLLSATPTTARPETHLALLHLLDPTLYRWQDRAQFTARFQDRRTLARAVHSLDADFEPLIPSAIDEIAALIPEDTAFRRLADDVTGLLTAHGDLQDEALRPVLRVRVDGLRAHISETYRLHRRVIRHRRHNVLAASADSEALPFEVTGRRRPEPIAMPAGRAMRACDVLLGWQQQVSHWLLDQGAEQHADAYGQVLAVLSSRVDDLTQDLHDALRWRVHRDEAAATRAGLTADERHLLASPAVLAADELALDKLADDRGETEFDPRPLARAAAQHCRTVVFCGAGSLAGRLADCFNDRKGLNIHEHSHRRSAEDNAAAVDQWRADGGVLVADDSAEDGVNLQDADAVIHVRLPWSPNRCEQRLGRIDRFAGVFGAARQPAPQLVVQVGVDDQDFTTAWSALLTHCLRIFDDSVSALQEALDGIAGSVWEAALRDGPAAMLRTATSVTETLTRERRDIDGMDMLEAVHQAALGRSVAESTNALEVEWRQHERAMRGYAGDNPGGLRFRCRTRVDVQHALRFERGPLLVSPRLLSLAGHAVPTAAMEGTFNRNTALRHPELRLLRLGNPFVDVLARVVTVDDRGQATAYWRRGYHGVAPQPYFGLDFLVEADIDPALETVADRADAQRALRRQADAIFPPFLQRVWLTAGSEVAIVDRQLLAWLDARYSPERGDVNLSDARVNALWEWFGGPDAFAAAARQAEQHGRIELIRSADLLARGQQARAEAERALAIRQAQAQARQRAGRLLSDTESYLDDVNVTSALVSGLGRPRLRLMAITCLVGGPLPLEPPSV